MKVTIENVGGYKKFNISGLDLTTIVQPDGDMYAYKLTVGQYYYWFEKYYDRKSYEMAAYWPKCDGCNKEISSEYYKQNVYLLMTELGFPCQAVCEECYRLVMG